MNYSYGEQTYNKRSITDNVLVKVISSNYQLVTDKTEEYSELADCLKNAELVSQSDSCPIVGREELRPIIDTLRTRTPKLRARQTQTGTAVSTEALSGITDQDALFQIANGSIANIASSYEPASRDALLAAGVLPLVTAQSLEVGTYIFLENIRQTLDAAQKEITAFLVKETLVPIQISVDYENREQLQALFAE